MKKAIKTISFIIAAITMPLHASKSPKINLCETFLEVARPNPYYYENPFRFTYTPMDEGAFKGKIKTHPDPELQKILQYHLLEPKTFGARNTEDVIFHEVPRNDFKVEVLESWSSTRSFFDREFSKNLEFGMEEEPYESFLRLDFKQHFLKFTTQEHAIAAQAHLNKLFRKIRRNLKSELTKYVSANKEALTLLDKKFLELAPLKVSRSDQTLVLVLPIEEGLRMGTSITDDYTPIHSNIHHPHRSTLCRYIMASLRHMLVQMENSKKSPSLLPLPPGITKIFILEYRSHLKN